MVASEARNSGWKTEERAATRFGMEGGIARAAARSRLDGSGDHDIILGISEKPCDVSNAEFELVVAW